MKQEAPDIDSYHEGFFPAADGLKLFYRFYSAGSSGSETLILLHGQGEHSGRYQKFSGYLKKENVSLAILDYRGHGRSEGAAVYVNSFEDYLKDISSFNGWLGSQHGKNGKKILLGHSLGGLLAVHWAKRFPEKVKALILSSPCLGLKIPGILVAMNRVFNRFMPWFCYQNPVFPPYLTHDVSELENYKKDFLIQRKISVRMLNEMLNYMYALEAARVLDLSFPLYVLMAGDERVVDPGKTRLFFEKVKAPDKELKIFSGFYHEIFNEVGQAEVFKALSHYLRIIRSLPQ
jgi:alpha-beta hydrolase superfamily lysophospholipase